MPLLFLCLIFTILTDFMIKTVGPYVPVVASDFLQKWSHFLFATELFEEIMYQKVFG